MFKKIVAMLLLALCTASFTVEAASWNNRYSSSRSSSRRIDQSSRNALIASLMRAAINNNPETMFELYTPEAKQQMIAKYGSRNAAINYLRNTFNPIRQQVFTSLKNLWGEGNFVGFLNAILDQDANRAWNTCPRQLRNQIVQESGSEAAAKKQLADFMPQFSAQMINGFMKNKDAANAIVYQNGKYYFTVPGNSASSSSNRVRNTPAQGTGIYSQKELIRRFVYTLYMQDMDGVWALLTPAEKRRKIQQYGSEYKAKNEVKRLFVSQFNDQQLQFLRNAVQNEAQLEQLTQSVLSKDLSWTTKINGQWYIDKL